LIFLVAAVRRILEGPHYLGKEKPMKRTRAAGLLALMVVLSPVGQVFAQSKTTSGPDLDRIRKVNEAREAFLPQVLEMNAVEAELGRLGARRAQSSEVREFARMLARVHGDTLENLGGLHHTGSGAKLYTDNTMREKSRPNDTMREKPRPDALMRDALRNDAAAWLNRVSDADFDREFMKIIVEKHRAAAAFLQNHLASIDATKSDLADGGAHPEADAVAARVDEAFANLCRQLLPVVNSHLRHAEALQGN
jgi:predicted outer membrane protein